NAIHVYDPATGKELSLPRRLNSAPYRLALTPDGKTLVTPSGGLSLILWDPATGKERRRLEGHSKPATDLILAADGRTLVSSGMDGAVCVWDVATAKLLRRLTGEHLGAWPRLMAVAPDGKAIALVGKGATRQVIDAQGKLVRRRETGAEQAVGADFRPGGRVLVGGGY